VCNLTTSCKCTIWGTTGVTDHHPSANRQWTRRRASQSNNLAQVFRDAAEEASTAASDGTPVPARSAAVSMALAAAQGPSPASAGASAPAQPGPGSGASGGRPPAGDPCTTGPTLTVALGSVPQESELNRILLKGVGREVRALGRNFDTQGRTFPKLCKFLAKAGAATREARGVKLHAKPKGSTSRSGGGEEREPRQTRPAASVALPVGAASAAAALAVMDYGTAAERAEWAAVLAAAATPVDYGPRDDVPVLRVDILPHASGWQRQPAWGGRPELYPFRTGAGRGRGTLAPGTPVPPRASTVFLHSDCPPRLPRGGAPRPRCGAWGGAPESGPPPRRRGDCSFCGHLGHWVWERPVESPELRAHGRALREAVAAHRNGR